MQVQIEKNIEEILKEQSPSVILLKGPEGVGKTSMVKKFLSRKKAIVKYFKYEEGQDNYQKMLEVLDLGDSVKKYLTIANAFSPVETRKNYELIVFLIMTRINELKNVENLYFVLDDLEKMDTVLISLFFDISSKFLKENPRAKMIGIYQEENKNKELENIIDVLKSFGAVEIAFTPCTINQVQKIIEDEGYKIPEKIISLLYEESKGNLKKLFKSIKMLEDKNYIIEKTFIKILSEKTLNEISALLKEKTEERTLENLSPEEMVVLIYLSLLNEKIDSIKLMELVNLKEEDFVNAVDSLVRKKILIEDGDFLDVKDKDIINYIEKSFSRLRIKDTRLKIAKYLEGKGELYRAGIQYYYANESEKAYEILSKVGKNFYQEGNFYNALNALTMASSIKMDDKEILDNMINILKLQDDYEAILQITKKILEKEPDDVINIINHGDALFKLSEFEEAKKYYEIALEKAKNNFQIAKAKFSLGRYYYTVEDFNKSVEILTEAIELSREEGDHATEEKAFRILGNIEYEKSNYSKALFYYEKAKTISESIGNYYDLAATYNNIGNISSRINLKEGKYYYLKAQEISEKFWFPSFIQTLSINLGILEEYQGNYKDAINLIKRAMGLSIADKSYDTTINTVINILDPLVKMGKIAEAEKFVNLGLNFSKRLGKQHEETELEIFRKLLNKIKGYDDDWLSEIEKIKSSGIQFYIDFANASLPMYHFYSGIIEKTLELYWDYIKGKIENPTTDDLMDIMDYIELLAYKNYFDKGLDERFRELVEFLEKNEMVNEMKFIRWRLEIIKAAIMLENKNQEGVSIFRENIKNIEDQDLAFLLSRLKIIFGLYLFKNFNDRSILDEGIDKLKSLNLKGAEKAFERVLSL
ncbi:MAG: hypothetical protein ACP5SF_02940 [Thermoplasmata archaeon]